MISRFSSVLAACCVLGVLPASAATVSFSLDDSLKLAGPGDTVTFSGTVMNVGASTAFLNGTSWVFPFSMDDTPFLLNFPVSLPPGNSASGALFTVAIPLNAPIGVHVGAFSILGGDTATANDVLASEDFGVQVVPEPGTIALLASGLLLFVIRRRGFRS